MKIRITATVSLEAHLYPSDYSDLGDNPSVDQVIAFEQKQMQDNLLCSALGEQLLTEGDLSDIKIEKMQEEQKEAA